MKTFRTGWVIGLAALCVQVMSSNAAAQSSARTRDDARHVVLVPDLLPTAMASSDEYTYVANADGTIRVLDHRTQRSSMEKARFKTPFQVNAMAVSGDTLAIASAGSLIQLVDVSASYNPRLAGVIESSEGSSAIAVDGTLAVVASWDQVSLVDIARIDAPSVVGTCSAPGEIVAIDLSNSTLVIATRDGNVSLYDVSSPAFPKIGSMQEVGAPLSDVAMEGHVIALAGWGCDITIMTARDDRTALKRVATIETSQPPNDLAFLGDRLCARIGRDVLQAWDMKTPGRPRDAATLKAEDHHLMMACGATRWVAADRGRGIEIFDPNALPTDRAIRVSSHSRSGSQMRMMSTPRTLDESDLESMSLAQLIEELQARIEARAMAEEKGMERARDRMHHQCMILLDRLARMGPAQRDAALATGSPIGPAGEPTTRSEAEMLAERCPPVTPAILADLDVDGARNALAEYAAASKRASIIGDKELETRLRADMRSLTDHTRELRNQQLDEEMAKGGYLPRLTLEDVNAMDRATVIATLARYREARLKAEDNGHEEAATRLRGDVMTLMSRLRNIDRGGGR